MIKKDSQLYRIREMMAYNIDGGKSLLTEAAGFDKLFKIFINGMKALAKTKAAWKTALNTTIKYQLKLINQTKIQMEMAMDGIETSQATINKVLDDVLKTGGKQKNYTGRGSKQKNQVLKWMTDNPKRWHKNANDPNISTAGKQSIMKAVSGDPQFKSMMNDYIMKSYEPKWSLLPSTDEAYKLGKYIDDISFNNDFRKLFDEDFLKVIDDALETIHGVRRTIRKHLAVTVLKIWPGNYTTRINDIMDGVKPWGATFKWSLTKKYKKFINFFKSVDGIKGLLKVIFIRGGKLGFIGRIAGIAGLFMLANYLKGNLGNLGSIMNTPLGQGNIWQSLPPEVKNIYGIPEADGKRRAQAIWTEIYETPFMGTDIDLNVIESKILDQLTEDPTSYLIIAQISYEFMMIPENEANKTLYTAMNEQLSNIIDYIGSFLSQKTNIVEGIFTASDIVVAIEQDASIPIYKARPEFAAQVNDLKGTLLTDLAQMRAYKVYSPQAIAEGKYGLYYKFGMYMGPNQMAIIASVLESKGYDEDFGSWYASPTNFKKHMSNTTQDDWGQFPKVFNASIEGEVNKKGQFKPNSPPPNQYKFDNSSEINDSWNKIQEGLKDYTDKMIGPILQGDKDKEEE